MLSRSLCSPHKCDMLQLVAALQANICDIEAAMKMINIGCSVSFSMTHSTWKFLHILERCKGFNKSQSLAVNHCCGTSHCHLFSLPVGSWVWISNYSTAAHHSISSHVWKSYWNPWRNVLTLTLKISLVTILTISHKILVMSILGIWYWISWLVALSKNQTYAKNIFAINNLWKTWHFLVGKKIMFTLCYCI